VNESDWCRVRNVVKESEWWRVRNPAPMLGFLEGRASDRKLRLVMVAWCRRAWDSLPKPIREFVDATDRYVEGELTGEELMGYRDGYVEERLRDYGYSEPSDWTAPQNPWTDACESFNYGGRNFLNIIVQQQSQTDLLREIFGPLPFRPVTVQPSWVQWNDGTVLHLAQSIYDDRRFEDLPILADALEDSGCTDTDILGHCRSGRDHVRGCWVVDLVLRKT
jgi:hypothetical protein